MTQDIEVEFNSVVSYVWANEDLLAQTEILELEAVNMSVPETLTYSIPTYATYGYNDQVYGTVDQVKSVNSFTCDTDYFDYSDLLCV